jgi:hypothetical protein
VKKWGKILILAVVLQAGVYIFLDRVLFLPAADFSQQIVSEGDQQSLDPDKLSTDKKYLAKIGSDAVVFVTADNKTVQEVPLQTADSLSYFAWVPNTHLALLGVTTNETKSTTITLKPINLDTNAKPVEPQVTGLAVGSKLEAVAFSPQVNVTYMLITAKPSNLIYRTDANNKLTKELTSANITRIACLQSQDTLLYDNKLDGSIYTKSIKGTLKLAVPSAPKGSRYALIGADKNDYIYIGRLNTSGLVTEVLQGSIKGNFISYQTLINPSQPVAVKVNYDGQMSLE